MGRVFVEGCRRVDYSKIVISGVSPKKIAEALAEPRR